MGICISYQGSLSDPATLDEALIRVRQFCHRTGWRCEDFSEHYSGVVLVTQTETDGVLGTGQTDEEPWPELPEGHCGLRARVSRLHPPVLIEETAHGVIVTPPDTESLRLVFDRAGRLVRYLELPAELVINSIPGAAHYAAFPNFVKTSGATASHVALCVLLHILQQEFIKDLQVTDDAGFWGTWDLKQLERKHAEMCALLGIFRNSKNLAALLRNLGVDIPAGGKTELLDPSTPLPSAPKKKKKTSVN